MVVQPASCNTMVAIRWTGSDSALQSRFLGYSSSIAGFFFLSSYLHLHVYYSVRVKVVKCLPSECFEQNCHRTRIVVSWHGMVGLRGVVRERCGGTVIWMQRELLKGGVMNIDLLRRLTKCFPLWNATATITNFFDLTLLSCYIIHRWVVVWWKWYKCVDLIGYRFDAGQKVVFR